MTVEIIMSQIKSVTVPQNCLSNCLLNLVDAVSNDNLEYKGFVAKFRFSILVSCSTLSQKAGEECALNADSFSFSI